jgi:hypothetical protein
MSRTLKITFPDISYEEKTRLTGATGEIFSAGSSSLVVRNPSGFEADDFIILDAFESEDGEIVQIQTVDRDSRSIDLKEPTLIDHPSGVIVIKTPFDQVKIFKGLTNVVSTHTEFTGSPFDLRSDNAYTYVNDIDGTSLDFYSYQYLNSETNRVSIRTLYTDSSYDNILTVDTLKRHFMFGLDLTDDDGNPFPNSMFEFAIRAAVDSLEKTLQIIIKPTALFEFHDFFAQDYRDFAFIQLNHYPIISVDKVQIQYPTAQAPIDFPLEWVQLRKERGNFHLVPTSGALSTILMGRGGDYLTFVWRGFDFMPNLWRIWYTAGMDIVDPNASGRTSFDAVWQSGIGINDVIGIIGRWHVFIH